MKMQACFPVSYNKHQAGSGYSIFKQAKDILMTAHFKSEHDAEGKIRELLEANEKLKQEIASLKSVEENLKNEKAFIESSLNTLTDAFLVFDAMGRFLRWNKTVNRVTGYSNSEISNMKPTDFFSGEDVHRISEAIEQTLRYGYALVEASVVTKDGTLIPYEFTGGMLLNHEGNPESVCVIGRNIAERKQAEEALQNAMETLQGVLNASQEIIFAKDEDGRYVLANGAFAQVFKKPLEQILGKKDHEIFPRAQADLIRSIDFEVFKAGKPVETEDVLTVANQTRIFQTTKVPLRDAKGRITGLCAFAKDITENKRADEAREKLEAQLRQSQKMEAIGRLAGGVAHDFGNMLTIIIGNAQLAKMDLDPQNPLHHDLNEILEAAKKSRDLTKQLLAFARKQTVAPKILNLNQIIDDSKKLLRRLVGEDIDVEFFPEADLWKVKIDPSQVDQILANLAINARDAISGVGSITIDTRNILLDKSYCRLHRGFRPGEYAMIGFSDSGIGMDKTTLEHIFEPFFTTKGEGKGTGLGLSTIYGIVKQNNGFINAYSEPGQGTTFKIYLPRYEGDVAEVNETHDKENLTGTETILVVEDDKKILSFCKRVLERLGYTVFVAGMPGEAIELCKNYHGEIHLLITDVVMPELNGKELKEQIESIKPDIKVLFMSGYTANVIAHKGVLASEINFIEKPFSPKDLAGKVRDVLTS